MERNWLRPETAVKSNWLTTWVVTFCIGVEYRWPDPGLEPIQRVANLPTLCFALSCYFLFTPNYRPFSVYFAIEMEHNYSCFKSFLVSAFLKNIFTFFKDENNKLHHFCIYANRKLKSYRCPRKRFSDSSSKNWLPVTAAFTTDTFVKSTLSNTHTHRSCIRPLLLSCEDHHSRHFPEILNFWKPTTRDDWFALRDIS